MDTINSILHDNNPAYSFASTDSLVKLVPPLPCHISLSTVARHLDKSSLNHDQKDFNAKILALKPTTLLVEMPNGRADVNLSTAPPSTAVAVKITLNGTLHFVIAASVSRTNLHSDHTLSLSLDASEPAAVAQLQDLLNIVRKDQHIGICATQNVEASDRYTGFEDIVIRPVALPAFDWSDLSTSVDFLGYRCSAPILITGMTGGVARGASINRHLAAVAQKLRLPMGVGSQRLALENPAHAAIFSVKDQYPDVFLIGNIGAAQLQGSDCIDLCLRAVEMIQADALAIHVNVLQEAVQVEGDRYFSLTPKRIEEIKKKLPCPLIVKEVGSGFDVATARQLADAGIDAIDVGGKGGTSWSYIEGLRATSPEVKTVSETFRNWGIPTAISLAMLRKALPNMPLIATGGVRDGLTVAKALAAGAQMVGVGLPFFKAALKDEEQVMVVCERFIKELQTTMLCSSSKTLAALSDRIAYTKAFKEQLELFDIN